MIEKALMIIIFMYCVSFSIAGGQYVLADIFGITLVNFEGVPIQSHIVGLLNQGQLNTVQENIVAGNFTANSTFYDKIETFTTAAAYVAWELILLLSGTYIFNFMYLMGVPLYFVAAFVLLYGILLARAIIGYVRGI